MTLLCRFAGCVCNEARDRASAALSHAFAQYFGIVWAFEQRNLMKLLRVDTLTFGRPLAIAVFVGLTGLYGIWVEALDTSIDALWAITLVVSIMHFWYDGFVWSVRHKQV